MKKKLLTTFYLTFVSTLNLASAKAESESAPSPYQSLQARPIKALSSERISDLKRGSGMGFALAAELNHYAGPKHVLELKEKLYLSTVQEKQTKALFKQMQLSAIQLGHQIILAEKQLDTLFAQQTINEKSLSTQINKIAVLKGQLRTVHLNAHLQQHNILNPSQRLQYSQLRGYTHQWEHDKDEPHLHKHHH